MVRNKFRNLHLGHHSTTVTEIYAEKDERAAVDAMMNAG
jgi:hypothetical protein